MISRTINALHSLVMCFVLLGVETACLAVSSLPLLHIQCLHSAASFNIRKNRTMRFIVMQIEGYSQALTQLFRLIGNPCGYKQAVQLIRLGATGNGKYI